MLIAQQAAAIFSFLAIAIELARVVLQFQLLGPIGF